jgi:lipopolysaccharide export system permease protein
LKTLHTYLTRQVVASLLLTVAVFTFVLLLGNVLKEILSLLVNRQATLGLVVQAIGLLIPWVWVFALPMAMLTATLLVFGRFSADQELTAARASGISLLSLITPILLLSLALCAASALVNMEFGPRCRVAYKGLLDKVKVELTNAQLPEGRFIKDFKGYIFYVGKNRKPNLEDIIVFQLDDGTNGAMTIHAPRGRFEVDPARNEIRVQLFDATSVRVQGDQVVMASGGMLPLTFDLNPTAKETQKADISDMTFTQLNDELRDLERRIYLPLRVRGLTPEKQQELRREIEQQHTDFTSPIRFYIHRQVAFSFACFGFTLVGIPLGIRMHRRETNVGVALALVLVLIYYSFVLVGQSLATRPEFAPYLIVWLPNFIFQAVGAVLLWRANRGM